jgi:hypothetical protein
MLQIWRISFLGNFLCYPRFSRSEKQLKFPQSVIRLISFIR